MPLPPPEKIPEDEFAGILNRLASLILQLPTMLPYKPESDAVFKEFLPPFVLDPDYLDKTEDEIATIGEQLERVFGFKTRSSGDGILDIKERGPGLSAVHGVLVEYYHKYPDNMVHKKWIVDISNAVEHVYLHYNVPVCSEVSEMSRMLTRQRCRQSNQLRKESKATKIPLIPRFLTLKLSHHQPQKRPSSCIR